MAYQIVNNSEFSENKVIKRLSDNAFIFGEDNADYQQYLKWLEEGNTPLPPDPEPVQEPLTPQQKLEASGLTVQELKELLGLS